MLTPPAARLVLQSIQSAARNTGVAAGESSSCEVRRLFRVHRDPAYRRHWFAEPRHAVGACPGCTVFRNGTRTFAACRPRRTPSHQAWLLPSSFARLDRDPAPQRQAALMDFRTLQHIKGNEVHSPPTFQVGYVPPSGFGYPHDGFLPRMPAPDVVSDRQRS